MMERIDTVIVGAGPYGLSIAAHLKAARIPFKILGTPLESWRNFMPEGMFLRSEPFASSLWDPKRKYSYRNFLHEKNQPWVPFGKPVSLESFLEYADWFRDRAVGEIHDVRTTCIRKSADGFVLELAGGSSLSCRHVILATGHMPFRSLPAELGSLTEKVCQHTAQIRDVRKYSGKDVTVIGAGQSALETAALVSEAGAKVRLVVRKNQIKWNAPSTKVGRPLLARIRKPEAGLGGGWAVLAISELPQAYRAFSAEKRHRFFATSWGPSGSRWLRARVENRIEALTGHRIRSAAEEGGRVRLTLEGPDGAKELVTDHVIAGTGFKIGLERLTYLDPELRKQIALENLAPALSSRFETSVPGLFIVGIATAPTFGPVMRFMFGGKHAAPAITKRLRAARRFWRATRAD